MQGSAEINFDLIWKGNGRSRWKPFFYENCTGTLRKPITFSMFLTMGSCPENYQFFTLIFTQNEQEMQLLRRKGAPCPPPVRTVAERDKGGALGPPVYCIPVGYQRSLFRKS